MLPFGALVWLLIRLLESEHASTAPPHDAFFLGIALAVAACCVFVGRPTRPAIHLPRLLLAGGVFLLGALTRTIHLDRFPPMDGQLWEECQTGIVAYKSLVAGSLDEYFPITNVIAEIGLRLSGLSMDALRAPFVVFALLGLPLFYFAARSLVRTFDAALAATMLFASSAYLAAAGRVALETMAPVTTLCAALAATFYAVRHRTIAAFAATGLATGFLSHEYISFKLAVPFLLLTLILAAIASPPEPTPLQHRPSRSLLTLRHYRWHCGVLVFTFLAVTAPLLLNSSDTPLNVLAEGIFRQRRALESGGLSTDWGLWATAGLERIAASFDLFFRRGTSADLLPTSLGVVDRYTGIASFIALAYCALTAGRDVRRLFLAVVVPLTIVLAGLLVDNPARYRLTPLPALCFLALAVPLDDLFAAVSDRAARYAVAIAVIAISVLNVNNLLGAIRDPQVLAEFGDLRLTFAQGIAATQRRRPDALVFLATDLESLDRPNDFSFLYDFESVRIPNSLDDIGESMGTVIAQPQYLAGIRALPQVASCRESVRSHGTRRLEWAICDLEPPGPD
jgi:hypothetical protein